MAETRVLGFGTATLDYRIRTADLGEGYREKLLAQEVEVLGGGAIANCLVQVSRLGGRAVWLGKLGKDRLAEEIIGSLTAEGIDCSGVLYDETLSSPFNLAVYAGPKRRRVGGYLVPGSLAALSEADVSTLADSVRSGDWAVVEIGEVPLDRVLKFCRQAKLRDAHLAADVDLDPLRQCGADRHTVEEIFSLQDLIMANHRALETLYGTKTAEETARRIARLYPAKIVVSAGAEGCQVAEYSNPVRHLSAIQVKVVDPVGAGDAFHGGLLFALAEGRDFGQGLEVARRCAALNCLRFGAREGMPNRAEMEGLDPGRQNAQQSNRKEGHPRVDE
jgi:sugar/nucleoside kinase (ribokinase family)